MATGSAERRARGEIETLPSGSLRVRVYAGIDPASKKRQYLVQTVPAGADAADEADRVRARLLREVAERRGSRQRPPQTPGGGASDSGASDIGAADHTVTSSDTAVEATSLATSDGGKPRRRRGALTVAAIARLAGVSPPTVSKVLNGRPGVAPKTRRRVEELLLGQNYRRPEKVTRAACVEVVFYGALGQVAMELLRGVKQVVVERDFAVGFTDVVREAATGRNWERDLLSRRPAGVITVQMGVVPEQHGLLAACAIPVVVVDPTVEPLHPVPSVAAANRRGAFAAAQHLLALGHRRIAVISGPLDRLCARERLDGVRAALAAGGAPLDERLLRPGLWFSFDDGHRQAAELLRLGEPPTAVLCGNDLQAFGAYEAARQAGLRIPDDLSVVGFDDISYAGWCGPPLTTVRQPITEMGATAARLVLALTAGETISQTHVELATTLVVRGSTAAPARQ
ncbi:LacI family DNA-binding transcriptional regulator [Micromonospora sp. WMMD1102]|uniref:LacI family DNA-binding transcriptional regulator n=1 Tax=Micromonospora sp. WMMD1102 TaxID=3016105 RepID=UPI002414E163|nr:LacI family DNA-binding transcriptional regulator [Micromonospora sp. WMMD1102]MDG4786298.1 LacI family DNA-binding transcriptional regulator [Micromonospora sp. WMMD1102]